MKKQFIILWKFGAVSNSVQTDFFNSFHDFDEGNPIRTGYENAAIIISSLKKSDNITEEIKQKLEDKYAFDDLKGLEFTCFLLGEYVDSSIG